MTEEMSSQLCKKLPLWQDDYARFRREMSLQSFAHSFWTCDFVEAGPIESLPLVSWLVSNHFYSKTTLTIFLNFCMKVPYYKGKKLAQRFVRKKSLEPFLSKRGD